LLEGSFIDPSSGEQALVGVSDQGFFIALVLLFNN
jgi:hypothetical protein